MRRAHRALYRGQELLGAVRARGDHLENFRGRVVLLRAARAVAGGGRWPRRQRLRQGRAAATADGIRSRGAEADLDLAGRFGWIAPYPEEAAQRPSRRTRNKIVGPVLRDAPAALFRTMKNGRM